MKIVALAAEPSLAAALNMMEAWEIVYASEPEQATQIVAGARVLLIGGGTEEGLRLAEVIRSLGVTIPTVVVGDEDVPEGARYPVILPPFTLDGLRQVIDRAVAGGRQSAPQVDIIPGPRPEPETERRGKHLSLAPEAPAGAPEPPQPVSESPAAVSAPPPPPPPAAPAAPAAARTPQAPAAASTAPREAPAAPQEPEQPAPRPVPPATVRNRPVPSARPVPPEAVIIGGAPKGGRGLLRRRPKTTRQPGAGTTLTAKLHAAADAVARIEDALEDLPVLTDLRELTQALLGEVVDLLEPQTAAIYLPGPDGFRVWASHKFSNVERTMAVQTHQPLFADLLVRHEALLIEPVDLAQTLVAGVGGARTNAFLASPIESNQKCVGVVVAGRDHFENEDLDRLEALAEEAAAGLAVALGLDRLKGLL